MSEAPRIHHFDTGWPEIVITEKGSMVWLRGFRLFNWLLVNKDGKWIWIWDGKQ
jgi:hypothetical protein